MTVAPDAIPAEDGTPTHPGSLTLARGIGWVVVAVTSFHAAQVSGLAWLLIPCAYALIELSRAPTHRKVFYPTLGVGFLFYAPQLGFFWSIFGPAAIALWMVLSFWLAFFGLLLRLVRLRLGNGWMLLLAPFIWTGLEYFRCELYYLRFGWLTFGMANHLNPALLGALGCFIPGTLILGIAVALNSKRESHPRLAPALMVVITAVLTLAGSLVRPAERDSERGLQVAGVQLEAPMDEEVLSALNQARTAFPDAQLFMLSEYTFQTPPPQAIRNWCASNQVYLVVGGVEPLGETNSYNMAYVIGTNGAIVHQQVKSVPIQFFKDGLPAPSRKVWDSPWGKLGVLTCYDLSYTRVVDDFVEQGAIALLNPTMDVADWGAQQHNLHARVVRVRAAEYGIPIFRVASSGISLLVSPSGRVLASAPYPGAGKLIGGRLPLDARPRLPLDRWLAPVCAGVACLAFLAGLIPTRRASEAGRESPAANRFQSARPATVLRWIARLWSLASIGIALAFVIGDGFNPAALKLNEAMLFCCFPLAVLVGLGLAWKWPKTGGTVAVAGILAFYGLNFAFSGRFPSGFAFLLIALPGALFIISARLAPARSLSTLNSRS